MSRRANNRGRWLPGLWGGRAGRRGDQAQGPLELGARGRIFAWLAPPPSLGALTIVNVHATDTPEAHRAMVERWARSAWGAWSPHHAQARAWADELG
jgi:hypothetical protein